MQIYENTWTYHHAKKILKLEFNWLFYGSLCITYWLTYYKQVLQFTLFADLLQEFWVLFGIVPVWVVENAYSTSPLGGLALLVIEASHLAVLEVAYTDIIFVWTNKIMCVCLCLHMCKFMSAYLSVYVWVCLCRYLW